MGRDAIEQGPHPRPRTSVCPGLSGTGREQSSPELCLPCPHSGLLPAPPLPRLPPERPGAPPQRAVSRAVRPDVRVPQTDHGVGSHEAFQGPATTGARRLPLFLATSSRSEWPQNSLLYFHLSNVLKCWEFLMD